MRWIKKYAILFVMLALLMAVKDTEVQAAETAPDISFDTPCSLKISVKYTEEDKTVTSVAGIQLGLYKAADVTANDSGIVYRLTTDYQEARIHFSGMTASQSNEAAKTLASIAEKKNLKKTVKSTDDQGKALFSSLSAGMYLVKQVGAADGAAAYEQMQPFLVMLPMEDNVDGIVNWKYDVETEPKVELVKHAKNDPQKPAAPKPPVQTSQTVKTGDQTNLLLWIGCFIMGGAGMVGAALLKRRSGKSE